MCAPSPVATSPRGTRRGREGAHSDLQPSPAPRGWRRTERQVSWLPDLPTPGPSHVGNPLVGRGSTARSGTSPVSYPVTVAGAAPDSHRLPFHRRRASSRGGGAVTAPSVLSTEPAPSSGWRARTELVALYRERQGGARSGAARSDR